MIGNHRNRNQFLNIKQTLHSYIWTMECLMKSNNESDLYEHLFKTLRRVDDYLDNIYVQFKTQPDGTLTYNIKKRTLK